MERKGMRNINNSEKQEMMEPPEGVDGERPEMPTDGEAPEMPSDMGENMQGGFGGGMREMNGEFPGEMTVSGNSDAILHPAEYLAIGGGSVVLGILISYVCFSRFFKDKPGQAFATKGKFIGFIAVALVLAIGICLLGYFIPVWTQG